MVRNYSVRTDLALEERERFEADNVEVQGVVLEEEYDEERQIRVTRVEIRTENGAKAMGKPVGTYLTFETPDLALPDEDIHQDISKRLGGYVRELIRRNTGRSEKDLSVLVVGLGNRSVTPDALGPYVADHLNVTRHVIKEYGKYAMGRDHVNMISAVVLAARSSRRLNRTVQIADTGIHPGSGVGNHRSGLTEKTLGVPVIGIGVPTVVDAATIVNDTMENFIAALESSDSLKGVGNVLRSYSAGEKYEFVKELIAPHLNGMFVTPKDVDEMIHQISHTLAEALNMVFAGEA